MSSAGCVEPQHCHPLPGMRQDDPVDVESVSDELYGLPLDDFTSVRNDREKQAKAAGERDLAAQIHQLTKPNLVAWLANQLARERADEIRPLLELGTALREATATLSGQQLRELSRQQRQLVDALVQQARRLANAAGRKVSEDTARGLQETLRAALVDPHAAEALAAGRLTEGMQYSGFGSLTGGDEPARSAKEPTAVAARPPTTGQRAQEQNKRAEYGVEQATSAANKAITARQETYAQLEAADQKVAETGGRVDRVRQELEEALQAQSKVQKEKARAQAAFDRADRDAQDAQQRLADSTDRLDR
jgi:chromosome segregation ATPase